MDKTSSTPKASTGIDRRHFNRMAAGTSAIAAAGWFPAIVRAQATKLKVGVHPAALGRAGADRPVLPEGRRHRPGHHEGVATASTSS